MDQESSLFAQCHTAGGGWEKEPGLEVTGAFHWTPKFRGPSTTQLQLEHSGNIRSKTDKSNNP